MSDAIGHRRSHYRKQNSMGEIRWSPSLQATDVACHRLVPAGKKTTACPSSEAMAHY